MRALILLPLVAASLMLSGLSRPQVSHAPFGVTAGGEAVERYTLRNGRGSEVSVLTYGAILDAVRVRDRRGYLDNVVLDLADLKAHEARANFSALVGRFANRISGGGFTLDGQRVVLDLKGGIVSHGGRPGFSGRVWTAEPCTTPGCRAVTLRYVSPDGENGFPGTLHVSVTYSLSDDDTLTLDYRATTDKPTVINLTNHAYFNLSGAASGSTDGHYLQLKAEAITALSDKKLPTGALRPVAGTPFDFRRPAQIGKQIVRADPQLKIGGGFDHNFVLNKPQPGALSVAARAWDPKSGRTLEMKTTEPGLQLFTGNGFNGTLKGRAGNRIWPRGGFALETQHFPDSPNHPEFPSTVLRPGEVFHSVTTIRFGTAKTLKQAFPD
ncbi:galactose mutarotase [Asticcacaulis sp. DXS10W]|uniref:Aldose 1-epimerase n=1 Tax=Asticcacaulis currens TaxID=2984210 RepID=A0ABT5IHH9_9CAUL|nr:aldose epimerase family protein [Asticcacaulis currens]MDC7695656.1 galactose mutarotase [Asticcacaulis currens]